MNMSMYHSKNQGVSASHNQHPAASRRLHNDQLSPLTAFELERE